MFGQNPNNSWQCPEQLIPSWEVPKKEDVIPIVKSFGAWYTKLIDRMIASSSGIPECPNALQVEDLPLEKVVKRIKAVQQDFANGIDLKVLSRSSSNQIFVNCEEVNRILMMDKDANLNLGENKKQVILGLLDLILKFCKNRRHYTLRTLYYMNPKLFKQQNISDSTLDDVCCLLGCTRSSLNVFASDTGVVGGVLSFKLDGNEIDCSKMGIFGQPIPPFLDLVTNMDTHDALFILFVEKHTAFVSLMEDGFYKDYPCIIITGMGMPSVATRRFMNWTSIKFRLPILALVDSDPDGLQMVSVCAVGSENMSYDSKHLATPYITWLGIFPTHLRALKIPSEDMSVREIKKAEDLLTKDYITRRTTWVKELRYMIMTKQKAKIEALNVFGLDTLAKTFLPYSLKHLQQLIITEEATEEAEGP